MTEYEGLSVEIRATLDSADDQVTQVVDRIKVAASARAIVAQARDRCAGIASQAFLRELRSELTKWVEDIQDTIATTPPPPLGTELIDVQWSMFDAEWFEIGDQVRLRVRDSVPIEIETFSTDLDLAIDLAQQACGRPVRVVGKWNQYETGRSTATISVSDESASPAPRALDQAAPRAACSTRSEK